MTDRLCRICSRPIARRPGERPSRHLRRVTCGDRECRDRSTALTLTKRTRWREEDRGYDTPCWTWLLTKGTTGYGQVRIDGRARPAHRAMYEELVGPVPADLHLDHLCRNRDCVNPEHLEPVTPNENWRRGAMTRLVEAQVAEIKSSPLGYRRLAALYGVSRGTIRAIKVGRTWKDVTPA